MSDQKLCNACGEIEDFSYKTVNGKKYLRSACRKCENRKRYERRKRNQETYGPRQKRYNSKVSRMRATGQDVPRWILADSRRSDKKCGRQNDLTREFIVEQIARGCSYCGEQKLRMTLDRIDNERGHTTDNVVPACIRCNYIRRNMPYEAWLCLQPGLRRARKQGLFGNWVGRARRAQVNLQQEDERTSDSQKR